MRYLKLFRLTPALMVAIALTPAAAPAQEDGTLTISGTFDRAGLSGTVGPDLAEVFANGDDYTWTLTLHGTTHSHYYAFSLDTLWAFLDTEIHATSFDLEFFGPDAATLNGIASEHIAGGTSRIYLSNIYTNGDGDDFALMDVRVSGPDMALYSQQHLWWANPLVPADADGYPVVRQEPFSIWSDYTDLEDWRPGNNGRIISSQTIVTFQGSVSELPGDFNQDGKVDAADYVAWRKSPSSFGGDPGGYNTWRTQFGQSVAGEAKGAASNIAIPEPSTLALLALAVLALLRRYQAPQWGKCNP